jgi:branched-chain amino acid transport system permease protein
MAIRDNEKFAIAMGKNVMRHKVQVSAIAGAIAAAAGGLYAQYVGFIDPSTFNLAESFSILCIVIVGGAGSFLGPLLGAMFIVLLPEFLLFVGLSSVQAANWRQIIFGAAIVILMIWRPQGLLGTYKFRGNE